VPTPEIKCYRSLHNSGGHEQKPTFAGYTYIVRT